VCTKEASPSNAHCEYSAALVGAAAAGTGTKGERVGCVGERSLKGPFKATAGRRQRMVQVACALQHMAGSTQAVEGLVRNRCKSVVPGETGQA
jgi:hypothetical protein